MAGSTVDNKKFLERKHIFFTSGIKQNWSQSKNKMSITQTLLCCQDKQWPHDAGRIQHFFPEKVVSSQMMTCSWWWPFFIDCFFDVLGTDSMSVNINSPVILRLECFIMLLTAKFKFPHFNVSINRYASALFNTSSVFTSTLSRNGHQFNIFPDKMTHLQLFLCFIIWIIDLFPNYFRHRHAIQLMQHLTFLAYKWVKQK